MKNVCTCVFIVFKIVSFGILFFLAISIIDANLELVSGFESFCSEKKNLLIKVIYLHYCKSVFFLISDQGIGIYLIK